MLKQTLTIVLSLVSLAVITTAQTDSDVKLLSGPRFVISDEDRQAGIKGQIKVAVVIDEDGHVKAANVYVAPEYPCAGNFADRVERVMRDAEKWVKTFKFQPATKNGKPVESRTGLMLDLDDPSEKKTAPQDEMSKVINVGVIKAIKLEKPRYPAKAREERAAGTVTVKVVIDEEGIVVSAQAIDGNPLLHFATREAVCSSKFSPTILQGKAVKVTGTVKYNFVP